jgi:hypothetical protein
MRYEDGYYKTATERLQRLAVRRRRGVGGGEVRDESVVASSTTIGAFVPRPACSSSSAGDMPNGGTRG